MFKENKRLKERIEYLERSNDRREDTILELRQEVNKLTAESTEWESKYYDLQQENERLKETNVYCDRTDCIGRIKNSRKYDSVYQEKEYYKLRIDKALKIIENDKVAGSLLLALDQIEHILRGEEDE